jgi:DNA end-binding protein Ku
MPATVWKGYISFGLISFPVRLFSAGRAEAVHFHMLHGKDLSRVKEVWYCAAENKPIERSEIVKGYEASKDEYVVVDDEELKKIAPATASTMDIVQFVRDSDVDPIYFEHSYYVGPGDDMTKPYALFLKALRETKHSAIAKVSMHGREHVVLIRTFEDDLVLHTLFYSDELHKANRRSVPAKMTATRKEIELATELIRRLSGTFNADQFHDTYRENVERLIEQKQKGRKITAEPKPRRAPVVDLMDALKKSLSSSARSARPAKAAAKRRKVA